MEEGNTEVKFTASQLKANFLLFIIIVLGYQLEEFHKRWFNFQATRKKSLILAPRSHGKTSVLTIAYIIWRVVCNPNIRVLVVSSTALASEDMLGAIKAHFEKNELLRSLFGNFVGKKWNNDSIVVGTRTAIGIKEPSVRAVGLFGTIVSGHFDLIIGDDIVKQENCATKETRDKMWAWLWMVLMPTVEGEIHFRGTRYHRDDLYGRLIKQKSTLSTAKGEMVDEGEGYLCNNYLREKAVKNTHTPEFAEDGREYPVEFNHPENLAALWEAKKDTCLKHLLELRKANPIAFALQYQNSDDSAQEQIFKQRYFNGRYKVLPEKVLLYAGTDLAVSLKESADYFVFVVVAIDVSKKDIYVIDWWRDRLTAPKQFEAIKAEYNKHKFVSVGIEAVAFQESLAQFLRENSSVPAKSIKVHKDKVIRAHGILGNFENGKVFFREGLDITDVIEEMCAFPGGRFDDITDAVVMAITLAVNSACSFNYAFA